ncbi:hypothetical protein I7I50_12274 [Histoplasma capsulatum G186AR]|uniref:Uncharacterized protein n=1 Tax=Ajellomyces capsulatus TaxID=5037 RepID=A0A8H8CRZ8_AJECA|nr:hypothetical protein I7I52_11414 [Histoplasma capsulatum]QSS70589.1 hypothetical protein I7I50_12274 [Histoplasma capsulatum G186AR]
MKDRILYPRRCASSSNFNKFCTVTISVLLCCLASSLPSTSIPSTFNITCIIVVSLSLRCSTSRVFWSPGGCWMNSRSKGSRESWK